MFLIFDVSFLIEVENKFIASGAYAFKVHMYASQLLKYEGFFCLPLLSSWDCVEGCCSTLSEQPRRTQIKSDREDGDVSQLADRIIGNTVGASI